MALRHIQQQYMPQGQELVSLSPFCLLCVTARDAPWYGQHCGLYSVSMLNLSNKAICLEKSCPSIIR
jgi:hypothetical protein